MLFNEAGAEKSVLFMVLYVHYYVNLFITRTYYFGMKIPSILVEKCQQNCIFLCRHADVNKK